jgi:hypothetical protein
MVAAGALLGMASGCAYYNGMYNARRAEREARRFEREGRAAEARDRWQRVVVHAETVATRHPRSRWAPDALLLSGLGLVHLEDYVDAAVVLERAVRQARTPAQRAEGLTLLGRANLGLGRAAMARADLDSAVAEAPHASGEALLWRGLALRELGDSAAALADFASSTHPRAPYERARTLIQSGDTAAALAQLDTLAGVRGYDESAWRAALDSLGALGAQPRVSRLAERLATRGDLTRGERARLLLDDGRRRLAAEDTAGARARYQEAALAAPDSAESEVAAVRITLLVVVAAGSDAALDSLGALLGRSVALGGAPAFEALPMARLLDRLGALARDVPVPDAGWFLRAEMLRDSLRAVPLAARAFAEMARRFPDSPWTPKALLAAVAAGHPAADSLRVILDARYAESPYRRAALGQAGASEAYVALEDSLSRSLATVVGRLREAETFPRRPAAPGNPRGAVPRPTAPSSRPDTLESAASTIPAP